MKNLKKIEKNSPTLVLVVEDSLLLSQALKFGLKKAGFEVLMALDGDEGIKLMKKNIPDIVLLDIMMPKINGVEVLKKTKDFKNKNKIKIIMLTNFSAEENIEECMSLGADDYLIKANFTIADIVKKIRKTVK
ncbi:MAG: response regulator [Patescibacteria group bacterium]|jgi:DNA-binding response OmpR family regulator|nr:response regulator [Patescibacteria group bacterium]